MVHRDDDRADALRELGAEVVVGDLTNPQDVADAMAGVDRMFFNMSVSPDYLTATSIVCAVALEAAPVEVIVNMSQMTVSQMTLTSTSESNQHRLHWLAEHIIELVGCAGRPRAPDGVHGEPVVHHAGRRLDPRPRRARAAVRQRADVADRRRRCRPRWWRRSCATPRSASAVYELTGPRSPRHRRHRRAIRRALGRPVTAEDLPLDEWTERVLTPIGLPAARRAAHRDDGAATPRGPLRPQHRRRRADHRQPGANRGAVRGRARRRV